MEAFDEAILAAEERLRLAMLSSDVTELDKMLSEDLLFTNHLGAVVSKQADLEMHASGDLSITELRLSDHRLLPAGDVVVVSARARIEGCYRGSEANGEFRFTRVWKREPVSGWQVVAGHASLVG